MNIRNNSVHCTSCESSHMTAGGCGRGEVKEEEVLYFRAVQTLEDSQSQRIRRVEEKVLDGVVVPKKGSTEEGNWIEETRSTAIY